MKCLQQRVDRVKTKAKTIVARILSGLKFDYLKEDESEFGKVDFGVLTVAMMIAALDGRILPAEMAAFSKLSEKCRVSAGEHAAYYNSALHAAGYILLLSQSGLSQKDLTQAFLAEAEKVLPTGFAGGKAEDIRRALVIWITIGRADGSFDGIERTCVRAFSAHAVTLAKNSALRAGDIVPPPPDWMDGAEEAVASGSLAVIRRFIAQG